VIKGEAFRGKHFAMSRYFHGILVPLLTLQGILVEFCLIPGKENASQSLRNLPFQGPQESNIYKVAGYTDYRAEDDAWDAELIKLMVGRKRNSRRQDAPHIKYLKENRRKI